MAYPWVGKIPWSRKWQPTPVFLPGESHGQRSPVSYIQSMASHAHAHEKTVLIYSVSGVQQSDSFIYTHTKSLQLCQTLCSPVDCSPSGSSIHGIPQARITECPPLGDLPDPGTKPMSLRSPALAGELFTTSAIVHVCMPVLSRSSHAWLSATLPVARQAPLSMGFSRQEYWSGLPCPPPRIFRTQGSNPHLLCLLP